MIITVYRIFSGFRNVMDTLSLVRPDSSSVYDELRVVLPDGYTVEDTEMGPAVFDQDGRHCELCLNNPRGTAVICCSADRMVGLKKAPEESAPVQLREARINAHLTQQQLADVSGVNVRQIQRVELGESEAGNLTARNILALADALGVDPHDLI